MGGGFCCCICSGRIEERGQDGESCYFLLCTRNEQCVLCVLRRNRQKMMLGRCVLDDGQIN